jgi:hypothetical protein
VPRLDGSLAVERTPPVDASALLARWCWGALGLLVVLAVGVLALSDHQARSGRLAPLESRAANAYARLPLAFVPNAGQANGSVRFYARGAGYSFSFTDDKALLALAAGDRGQALELNFIGANPNARVQAADRRSGVVNYFTASEQHANLATYGRLVYRNLWPGIDMVFSGKGGTLEYAFHVRPGAEISDIRLAYAGADGLSLDRSGALRIGTSLGALRDAPPHSFQRLDGHRVPVDSHYALAGGSYGFVLGHHDRSRPLVIDPSLSYSTYLGGGGLDTGNSIAVNSQGDVYISGITVSADFPTTAGAFDTNANGSSDAFVTKFDPASSSLSYSTYLGGSGDDVGTGIAVDSAGDAYVGGTTVSADFPTTAGAFDTSYNGNQEAFVTKLDPLGSSLSYSTYLGGSRFDTAAGIAVDPAGAAYVTGQTDSLDFPTTLGSIATTYNGGFADAFVSKLNPAGSAPTYSTYLGGSSGEGGFGITVDSAGDAYVTGSTQSADFPTTAGSLDTTDNGGGDAFAAKLDAAGSSLGYSTYLGGALFDFGSDIAVDSAGAVYLAGRTDSTNFPTSAGAFDTSFNGISDAFAAKVEPAGSSLGYSTYLGGSDSDGFALHGPGIAVDSAGAAYVTGETGSSDFPTTAGAFDTTYNGGEADAFVSKLNSVGSGLASSTFLGGSSADESFDIAIDAAGVPYLTGASGSVDFPSTVGAFDPSFNGRTDAIVAKLPLPGPPTSTPRCKVTNGGRITAGNGDRASFGGSAQSDASGNVKGEERYQDQGPAQPQSVKSIRITALSCDQARTRAAILGEATVNGSGTHAFRIDLQDVGEPGVGRDTYRIQLDTGYDSGVQTLEGGNVQILGPAA